MRTSLVLVFRRFSVSKSLSISERLSCKGHNTMQKRIPIGKVAEYLGIEMHKSTLIRWRDRGVLVNGKRVRLVTIRLGNRIFVDEAELLSFVEKINEDDSRPSITLDASTAKQEAIRQAETSSCLDKFGV